MFSSVFWALFSLSIEVAGILLLKKQTLPNHLSEACSSALLWDVDCNPHVASLRAGIYYPEATLQRTCTKGCAAALTRWWLVVGISCAGETWKGFNEKPMPLEIIPDMMRHTYNLSCLTDETRFCNTVAAQAAYATDPLGMLTSH